MAELERCWISVLGQIVMPSSENIDGILARKLNKLVALSPDELHCLSELESNPLKVKRGRQLTHEGQTGHKAYVLQSGWACSYKLLSDGGRQIISFPIAGDLVGLRSVLLPTADHSLSALTDALVTPVDAEHIVKCLTQFPRLGTALLWAASRDEAIVVEHLVNVGRRSAIERTSHFFIELAQRLSSAGLATETEFDCPLSQFVLADALGLTAIYVNRVLRQLRERDLLTLRRGRATIHDLAALRKLAGVQGVI